MSMVVTKTGQERVATVFAGPPALPDADEAALTRFVNRRGLHVVCGGTTAKIVSHHLGQPIEVDLDTMRPDVPPLARIQDVDLVTEGIRTLTKACELLQSGAGKETLSCRTDGAAGLVRLLLDVDHVHFIVGMAANPVHQDPNLPAELGMKLSVVREIAAELRKRGTEVSVESV